MMNERPAGEGAAISRKTLQSSAVSLPFSQRYGVIVSNKMRFPHLEAC